MGDTKTTLVTDLLERPASPVRDTIIARARSGYYHDFESPLGAPKMTLVSDLSAAGFQGLADKVRAGAYDDETC